MDRKTEDEINPFLPELLMVMVFITMAESKLGPEQSSARSFSLEGLD